MLSAYYVLITMLHTRDIKYAGKGPSYQKTHGPEQRSANFFLKSQIVNILDFESHMVSIATLLLQLCCTKAAMDNTQKDMAIF